MTIANIINFGQSRSLQAGFGLTWNERTLPMGATYPDQEEITTFNSATGWTILGTDTANLTTDLRHVVGTASLEFDKVDSAADTIFAGVYRTLSPTVDLSRFGPADELQAVISIPDKTNVVYAFIRLGTSVSHYNEWRLAEAAITQAVWQEFEVRLDDCQIDVVGNGWNPAAVAYVAVGVAFAAEANALADMYWNCLRIVSSRQTRT